MVEEAVERSKGQRIVDNGTVTCYKCNGSGELTCRTCNGQGTITCSTCEGLGTVENFLAFDHRFYKTMRIDYYVDESIGRRYSFFENNSVTKEELKAIAMAKDYGKLGKGSESRMALEAIYWKLGDQIKYRLFVSGQLTIILFLIMIGMIKGPGRGFSEYPFQYIMLWFLSFAVFLS